MAQTQIRGEQVFDGTIATADLGDNQVTLGKMAQMSTANFLGRNTAGTGNVEYLTISTVKTMLSIAGLTLDATMEIDPTGASSGQFLKYDGTKWIPSSVTASAAGSDTQVQYNDGGALGADSGFTYNKTTHSIQVTGTAGIGATPLTYGGLMVGINTANAGSVVYGVGITTSINNTTSDAYGVYAFITTVAGSYTLTNAKGLYVATGFNGAGVTITNQYGLYIDDQALGTNNYAIYTKNGTVRFNDTVEAYKPGGIPLKVGTDASHNMTVQYTSANDHMDFNHSTVGGVFDFNKQVQAASFWTGGSITGTGCTFNGTTATYHVTMSDTTDSTSSITGALIVSGGVGIAKNLNVGGNTAFGNQAYSSNTYVVIMDHNFAIGGDLYGWSSNVNTTVATNSLTAIKTTASTIAGSYTLSNYYGLYVSELAKGAGTTITNNYGIYIEDLGNGSNNYAIYSGTGNIRFGDRLAAGNASGITAGVAIYLNHSFGGGTTLYGLKTVLGTTAAASILTGVYGSTNAAAGSYTVGLSASLYAAAPTVGSGATVTTATGVYVEDITQGGTNNYAIYTGAGYVRIGDNTSIGGDPYSNVKLGVRGAVAGHYGLYMGGLTITPPASANGEVADFRATIDTGASNTVPSAYSLVIGFTKAGSGTITNAYGAYIDAISSAATNNYALYTNAGTVRFGDVTWIVTTATTSQVVGYFTAPSMANANFTSIVIGKAYSVNASGIISYASDATPANGYLALGVSGVGFGIQIDGNLKVSIPATTDTTSVSTGALVVSGGVGINKSVNIGATLGVGASNAASVGITVNNASVGIYNIVSDTGTNTIPTTYIHCHRTSSTPDVGFGAAFVVGLQTTTSYDQTALNIQTMWAVATHASRKSRTIFWSYDASSAREGLRIESTGTASSIGFLGAAAAARPTAYTQTYATASRTVPNATASNPPAGGTGTAAGGYDTAANRNAMITSLTNCIADVAALKQVVNSVIDDLQAYGLLG